ncbi:flavin containing amine oxidoreductase domain-containing protein [Ditylenchus destructor]|uniref:Flavin containing amine oxidoreductase domain-containing protein n=1 Tax=Ditylenchus destructor TaxID=166010 RepID=A0AAD4NDJ2_9BILA|nr:flavin containing amine oxidoreductase domain-containing protein [Ditylenchus destructor]
MTPPSAGENSVNKLKVVIIGAGPTCFGALHRLFQLCNNGLVDNTEVRVIEQESEPGGLARTITDPNGFSWDLGVHVTGASKYPEFLEVLQKAVPKWNAVRRCVKADMSHAVGENDGPMASSSSVPNAASNYVPYPVQNSIPYFANHLKEKCLADFEQLSKIANGKPNFDDNFDDFSRKIFGPTLQSIFIRPYNEKVWTVKLKDMSCKWVEGRVPRIDPDLIRRRCAISREQLALEEEMKETQTIFRYPAECKGIGEIWKRLVAAFPNEIFLFGQQVVNIDPIKKEVWTKSDENQENHSYSYDVLISTIPITQLGKLCGLAPEIPLRHSKVVLVGVGLHLPQSELARELSWAYYPRPEIIFYRCTLLSNFSLELTPDSTKYWSVLCEIGTKPDDEVDEELAIQRTVQDLIAVGIVESAGQVCSTWLQILPYGYPVPSIERDQVLDECHKIFLQHGMFSRGRFGGWRYEISNQDHSFECGVQLVDRILLGIPETLYQSPL